MSLIIDEFDKVKLHALLGQEYAEKHPGIAEQVINANAYRIMFLEDLPFKSVMLIKYTERLKEKGAIQDAKMLSEFARLTIACNIQRPEPEEI